MPRYKPVPKDEERIVPDPEKARQKTLDRAMNLLTYKPRSEQELRDRLLEKIWTNSGIVDEVIEKLRGYDYVNDEKYAASLAASKLRQKPVGRHRLRQELRRKKLDPEVVESALEIAFDEVSEEDLIDEAVEKRLRIKGVPGTHADKKKLFDHLVRLGFDYELVRNRLNEFRIEGYD